ncbi:MAG: hypothetical protein AAF518_14470 [Spirochaetota bacterium]
MKRKVEQGRYIGTPYTEKQFKCIIPLTEGLSPVNLFTGKVTGEIVNFSGSENPFTSQYGGRVKEFGLHFAAQGGKAIQIGSGNIGVLDSYNQLVQFGEVELKRGPDTVDEIALNQLLPQAPMIFLPDDATTGTVPVDTPYVKPPMMPMTYDPQSHVILKKSYKNNPLRYENGTALEMKINFMGGWSIPADLTGYQLHGYLNCEIFHELPPIERGVILPQPKSRKRKYKPSPRQVKKRPPVRVR